MGNPVSKAQGFMEQRERSNTEHRKQGTLSMNLVREEFNRDIQEVYDLRSGELLGKGGFGTVRVVTHKATQNKYALKTIELKDVETVEQYEFLLNEIEIMKQLDHPNIARVQEVFHTPDHYYMVMDLYTGGDMYARYKFRSEDETAKIVGKLINALRYCHDRGVAHRDIKLENICFESMADDAEVKLVDFGLSASFKDEQMRHDLVGSWAFMAPEVLQRAHHPQACDMWSMGVITYCLLAGFPPFRSVNLKGLKEQILYSKVTFEEEPWKNVSNTAKDFIQRLLKKDPQKRMTAQQAQHHTWLTSARSNKHNAKLSPKVVDNLRHFKNLNLMKRVALGVVARTLEASEMRNLEQEFHKADVARSGVISIEDFRAVLLRSNQFQRKEIDEIFEGLDIGSSGQLSYTDFTAAALNRQYLDTRRLKYAFERLDHDNNGFLDYEDLMMTVGSDLSTEDVRTAIKQFDTDNDGKVSFDDFCRGMRSTGGALDALSTAQLTSGYMVESIAKGEGAAAIQTLAEDLSAEKLQTPRKQEQRQHEEVAAAGHQVDGSDDGVAEAVAAEAASAEVAEAGATAEGGSPESTKRNSVSSSAETAAISRPQSLDGQTSGALKAGQEGRPQSLGRQGILASVIGGGAVRRSISLDRSGAAAADIPLGDGGGEAAAGGGAEATAPVPRKWSKEVPAGGEGAAAIDVWGEGLMDSLAGRRMRDSIRLRSGLGGLLSAHPRPHSHPHHSSLPSPNSTAAGLDGSASALRRLPSTPPTSSLQAQLLRIPGVLGDSPPAMVVAAAAAAGGALGAAAGSAKSGGDPAESESNRASSSAAGTFPRRKIVTAAAEDLPPRDSTAGEVDLGWGVEGVPADLLASVGESSGSSLGSAVRSPKLLRFSGATAHGNIGGSHSGNGSGGEIDKRRKKVNSKETARRRRQPQQQQQQGLGLFCTPGARRDGAGGPGGDAVSFSPTKVDAADSDVYRDFDGVSSGDGNGGQTRKRTGTFCVPGNAAEAATGESVPFWAKWMDGLFRGKPG